MSQVDLRELSVDRQAARPAMAGPRRRLLTRYVLPLALLLGFVAVLGWSLRDYFLPAKNVTVIKVIESRSMQRESGTPLFRAAGWVEPRPTAIRVPALAEGVVKELLVVEDQQVEANEPIARLVSEDAELSLQAAKAAKKLADAELEKAQVAVAAAQKDFDFPQALKAELADAEAKLSTLATELSNLPFELRRAEAALRVAQRDLEGKQASKGVVSQIRIDQAQSLLDAADELVRELGQREATLNQQHEALVRRRDALQMQLELKTEETRKLDVAKAGEKSAGAAVDQAQVALDEAQLRFDRMTVLAPVAGRVLHLLAEPGTFVKSMRGGDELIGDGGTVVTMYQPNKLQVRVDVRFEDLPQVLHDQPVLVESPAVPRPMQGRVLFAGSVANIQKNTLEVKVVIDEPPSVLKPEMLVDVTFLAPPPKRGETQSEELRLFVPQQLVKAEEGASFVWVADQSAGLARRVNVTLGPRHGPLVEVQQGLTVASRLIVNAPADLADGDRIVVTGEDESLGIDEQGTADQ